MEYCPNAVSGIALKYKDASACVSLCNYQPIYSISEVVGENKGTHLEYNFPSSGNNTKYRGYLYTVNKMSLYVPGLHQYEDEDVAMRAELVIHHLPENGGKSFNVCIPVQGGGTKDTLLDSLITQTLSLSNSSSSDPTTIAIPEFDISLLIPDRPFYSYIGKDMFTQCINTINDADFIVFVKSAVIKISNSTLNQLEGNIDRSVIDPSSDDSHIVYYNKNGPTRTTADDYTTNGPTSTTEDEIYISCQPTGSSDETTPLYLDKLLYLITPLYLDSSIKEFIIKVAIGLGCAVGIAMIILLIIRVRSYRAAAILQQPK